MQIDYSLIAPFLSGLKPVDIITVSEWADKYRRLSPKAAAQPGPWRTDTVPYLRKIQDALTSGNGIKKVVVMKGAQLGLTEAGNNWVGYTIHNDPAPMLMVMPTADTMKRNSEIRIDPMIEATPVLQEKIKPARSRDSGNTKMQKDFPGGILLMAGANSAAGLRSMPVKKLFLDEVDGYPANLENEGSPISLARARTRTFPDSKTFEISTPKIQGSSIIEKEFESTDQQFYFVPCPHCGSYQTLNWVQVKWDKTVIAKKQPATTYYECIETACQGKILERHKEEMLAAGEWRVTKPDNVSDETVGFHVNTLYSPFFPWKDCVELWIEAQGNTELLISFINTVLGEVWVAEGEAPDWQQLHDRREAFDGENVVPNRVGLITAGVDIQKTRIELEIVGWGEGNESWSLAYDVLVGDTEQSEVWQLLAAQLDRVFYREDGQEMRIRTMAVDTGYLPAMVNAFAANYPADRVVQIKGQDGQRTTISAPQAMQKKLSGKRAGTTRLINVGVSILKSELYGWLKRRIDPENKTVPIGYCHFPMRYDEHYFKMLTAEKLVYKAVARGFGKYEWVKHFERNEALDCRVYARAAALIAGIEQVGPATWRTLVGAGVVPRPRPAVGPAVKAATPAAKPPAAKKPSLTRGNFRIR